MASKGKVRPDKGKSLQDPDKWRNFSKTPIPADRLDVNSNPGSLSGSLALQKLASPQAQGLGQLWLRWAGYPFRGIKRGPGVVDQPFKPVEWSNYALASPSVYHRNRACWYKVSLCSSSLQQLLVASPRWKTILLTDNSDQGHLLMVHTERHQTDSSTPPGEAKVNGRLPVQTPLRQER